MIHPVVCMYYYTRYVVLYSVGLHICSKCGVCVMCVMYSLQHHIMCAVYSVQRVVFSVQRVNAVYIFQYLPRGVCSIPPRFSLITHTTQGPKDISNTHWGRMFTYIPVHHLGSHWSWAPRASPVVVNKLKCEGNVCVGEVCLYSSVETVCVCVKV